MKKVHKNHDRIHEPHESGSCECVCCTGSILYFDVLCALLALLLPLVTYVSITKDMVVEMTGDAGMRGFSSFLLSIIQEVYDKSTAVVPIAIFACGVREKVCRD